MIEFDPGPTKALARHLDDMPSYAEKRELFWYDWGPIFYRGRLNGSARLLAIASDPGPTERIAGRTLVGDAGQRVQGFLSKLGLTRSYVLVNAYAYALHPSRAPRRPPAAVSRTTIAAGATSSTTWSAGRTWRRSWPSAARPRRRSTCWDDRPDVPVFEVPHPSSRNPDTLVNRWRAGDRRPARDRHPRFRRRSAAAELRQQVPRGATTRAFRCATCPSGCRSGSATTPGGGPRNGATTTRCRGRGATWSTRWCGRRRRGSA